MRRLRWWWRFLAVTAILCGCGEAERPRLTVLLVEQYGYSDEDVRELAKEFEAQAKDYDVRPFFVTRETARESVLTLSALQARGYDVVPVDATWLREFVEGSFLLDITERFNALPVNDLLPFARQAFAVEGKQFAMPWLVDCQYLFYNRRMLKAAGIEAPPRTWTELRAQAKKLKEKGIVKYPFVGAWGHDESLICEFGSMLHARGGAFMASKPNAPAKQEPAFASQVGVETVTFMKQMLEEELVHPDSLEARSDEARHIFSQGDAAFTLNWLYVYDFANDPERSKVAGDVGMTLAPGEGGRRSASIVGLMGLAITKDCPHPDIAWRFITFLAGKECQAKYCNTALPSWRSLYDDPSLFATRPGVIQTAKEQYGFIESRPAVFYYPKFSMALRAALAESLTEKKSPQDTLAEAARKVREAAKERPVYVR